MRFLIENLYVADTVVAVYTHIDRMVTLGCMPVSEAVPLDKGIDCMGTFGTSYVLERREIGIFNLGGAGAIEADGETFNLDFQDCLYISRGTRSVVFKSDDASRPAKFYMVSAPAHKACKTTFLKMEDAKKVPMGDASTSNKRVINQFNSPGRSGNLPALHGPDAAGTGQCLEHHAGSYP